MSGNLPNAMDKILLNTIEEAIADIKAGKVVIVVDDEDRENEGDFICAAECVTPEIINFMATHGRGLICAPIDEKRADELDLPMMVSANTALHETAFTVSIDLLGRGCTTGISAYDRATGIRALTDHSIRGNDYARPGHIFPLRAKSGGVLRRTGHTEAAIDLARLAGFYPAGVLVEILNEDGTMARLTDLVGIAARHDLKIITIQDLVAYRLRNERLVQREITIDLNTKFGPFTAIAYRQLTTDDVHLALVRGTWQPDEPVLVRVHSSSETSDVLGLLLQDHGTSLEQSLARLAQEDQGMLLYMRHRENTQDVIQQLRRLQTLKNDGQPHTLEARPVDQRDYGVGAQILRDLNATKIRLLTNHPRRRVGIIGYGLEIVENVEL